jgi:replicative DNA helicase
MGKTAFALQIVEQIAVKMKKPVAYVSLRQPASVLLQRFICSLGRIDFCKIHAGFFGRLDFEAIKAATTRLSVCPFFVDDTPDLDIHSLCARVRHLNASRPLGLVIIDDLEFLELATRLKNGTSVDVPFAIKCLARETGVPFLLLSGLEEPTRSNPRIRLIEEIPASVQKFSDTVGFLWKTASEDSQVEDAELIISRNDDGGVGAIALCFQKGELRFEEHVDQRLGTIQSVES